MTRPDPTRATLRFVATLGVVNLFADLTYEGARSITGPFLGWLGASAAAVGFVAGFGELAGYGLRSIFGYFTDRTGRYWAAVFLGYCVNLLAVPALALAGNWPAAAALIVAERTGRAIRKPAVEALLAEAGSMLGHGWVFGLNEALDQAGATLGPLIVAYVLWRRGGYRHAFAALLGSAILCLATIAVARLLYPTGRPRPTGKPRWALEGFGRSYWVFAAGAALIAAGFADFSLIGFHFQKQGVVAPGVIPVFYSAAMATGAIGALALGWLLDRFGRPVLAVAFALPLLFPPLVFLGGFGAALAGIILWGLGMAAQDALLKATLARTVPADRRSTGFGVFDTIFGVAWFAGSAALGCLYEHSILSAVIFSVVLQALGIPVLLAATRKRA